MLTLTEKILLGLLLGGIMVFVFFSWSIGLVFIGLTAIFAGASMKEVPKDPATMAITAPFDTPSDDVLIKKPRIVFAHDAFPLWDGLIAVPMGPINFDFAFDEVTCGMEDRPDDDTSAPRSGGQVEVQISWTGTVKKDAPSAYRFVMAGREKGVQNIFEDRLAERVRAHASHKTWETFVGEKKPLAEKLKDACVPWLDDLGLETGTLNVKNIEPIGDLKEDAAGAAREIQQRRAQGLDTQTRIKNARMIVKAAKRNGEKITLEKALETERINRGLTKEIAIRADGNTNNPIIATALRSEGGHDNGNETKDDHGHHGGGDH